MKKVDWKALYEEMNHIADEALYLADAYAGGDSDTVPLDRRESSRFFLAGQVVTPPGLPHTRREKSPRAGCVCRPPRFYWWSPF